MYCQESYEGEREVHRIVHKLARIGLAEEHQLHMKAEVDGVVYHRIDDLKYGTLTLSTNRWSVHVDFHENRVNMDGITLQQLKEVLK